MRARPARFARKAPTRLSIDYPGQGERIFCAHYTLRISAPEAARSVDVSIDQGPWRHCRQAAGHWWYDWTCWDCGEHEVIARVRTREGEVVSCEPHEFLVDLEPHQEEANA
ncbi:MAG: hypothetical protein KGO96_02570 [Elusimicrobia bacterium]|nr:hypothetical protein [Elusimicrobiota bacterium]MDE2424778.1 hypothetical protein [Elusimicrobiota bacterium]